MRKPLRRVPLLALLCGVTFWLGSVPADTDQVATGGSPLFINSAHAAAVSFTPPHASQGGISPDAGFALAQLDSAAMGASRSSRVMGVGVMEMMSYHRQGYSGGALRAEAKGGEADSAALVPPAAQSVRTADTDTPVLQLAWVLALMVFFAAALVRVLQAQSRREGTSVSGSVSGAASGAVSGSVNGTVSGPAGQHIGAAADASPLSFSGKSEVIRNGNDIK